MFKFNQNVENSAKQMHKSLLRKASIVGVSALMLLGIGAQITSKQYNVHAETVDQCLKELSDENKASDYRDDKDEYEHFLADPGMAEETKSDDPTTFNNIVREFHYHLPSWLKYLPEGGYSSDLKTYEGPDDATNFKPIPTSQIIAQIKATGHYTIPSDQNNQNIPSDANMNADTNTNENTQTAVNSSSDVNTTAEAKQNASDVKSQIHADNYARKHGKKVSSASLRQQIKALKQELRKLENKIKLDEQGNNATTKKAKPNKRAKRTVKKHTRGLKKLATRKHKAYKHVAKHGKKDFHKARQVSSKVLRKLIKQYKSDKAKLAKLTTQLEKSEKHSHHASKKALKKHSHKHVIKHSHRRSHAKKHMRKHYRK